MRHKELIRGGTEVILAVAENKHAHKAIRQILLYTFFSNILTSIYIHTFMSSFNLVLRQGLM